MQLIAVQLDIVWHDKAANFERVRKLLDAAKIESGAMIVLPEMYATGFTMDVDVADEKDDKPAERFAAELSKQHQATVIAGVVNRPAGSTGDTNGKGFNEAVAFTNGAEVARYQKMQPFTLGEEDKHYEAGNAPIIFDWRGAAVSPFVCYDLRFPELFRAAARQGAEVIAVIANWPAKRVEHWLTLLRARAIENQAYVVGVNRCGSDPFHEYPGRSIIVDPHGNTLADAGAAECVITAAANLDNLREWRAKFPALRDMRSVLSSEAGF